MPEITERIDDKRAAKIEHDEYGSHLLLMNNGCQWSGAAIYSVEVAEAAVTVLEKYIAMIKENNNDQ